MLCKVLSSKSEVFQNKEKTKTFKIVKGAVENTFNGNVYAFYCFVDIESKIVPVVGQIVSCHDLKNGFEFSTIFIKQENGTFLKP